MDCEVSDDVIMTSSNGVCQLSLTACHQYDAYKPKVGRFCQKLVSRDTYDDIIMTSLNRLRPYSYINNPTKFGDDRMRSDQVIIQISQKWAIFRRNQWPVIAVMMSS